MPLTLAARCRHVAAESVHKGVSGAYCEIRPGHMRTALGILAADSSQNLALSGLEADSTIWGVLQATRIGMPAGSARDARL